MGKNSTKQEVVLAVLKHRDKKRIIIDNLKSVPCADCGVSYPPYIMQFDHRPDKTKFKNVSNMWSYSIARILEEASKCDIVCANCHYERTWKQQYPGL